MSDEEEKPKGCKISISVDAEGNKKVQLSEECKQSVNEVLDAIGNKQQETLYDSVAKLNEVKRKLRYNLTEIITRLPKDNPDELTRSVIDLKGIQEKALESIENAQHDVLRVVDNMKLGEEERDILDKLDKALTKIRGETSSQKMRK